MDQHSMIPTTLKLAVGRVGKTTGKSTFPPPPSPEGGGGRWVCSYVLSARWVDWQT